MSFNGYMCGWEIRFCCVSCQAKYWLFTCMSFVDFHLISFAFIEVGVVAITHVLHNGNTCCLFVPGVITIEGAGVFAFADLKSARQGNNSNRSKNTDSGFSTHYSCCGDITLGMWFLGLRHIEVCNFNILYTKLYDGLKRMPFSQYNLAQKTLKCLFHLIVKMIWNKSTFVVNFNAWRFHSKHLA